MRVLIVDDHEVVRAGVRTLLASYKDIEVCGEAIDGRDAITKVQKLSPDVVLMDISMPNLSGIEATRELRRSHPEVRVVMLSQYDFPHMLQQALNAGASAYVVKSHANTELAPALKREGASGGMPVYGSARKDTSIQTILRRSAELEEALRESEERFTLAQHVAQIGTFDLDLKTNLSKWTRKMEEMWGFGPGEFSGRQADWEARLHPDDRIEILHGLGEAATNGPFETEFRIVWPDGSVRWMLGRSMSLRDETGAPERLIGVNIDITERKQAEEELRRNRQELATEVAGLKLLQQISTELIREESVKNLYEKIADAAVAIMQSDFASMQMLYPERGERGELLLLAYRGFTPEAARFWEWVPADSGSTCAVALRTRQRVIAPDVEMCEFMAGTEDLTAYRQTGIRSVQSTPLLSRSGQLVGMISTHWAQVHAPTERDLRVFDVLARQAADLIERRRTEEAAKAKEQQLRALAARLDEPFIEPKKASLQQLKADPEIIQS